MPLVLLPRRKKKKKNKKKKKALLPSAPLTMATVTGNNSITVGQSEKVNAFDGDAELGEVEVSLTPVLGDGIGWPLDTAAARIRNTETKVTVKVATAESATKKTEHSNLPSLSAAHSDAQKGAAGVRSSAMRADITVSSGGGTMVVGGGRDMKEEDHDDGCWETVESRSGDRRNRKGSGCSGTATSSTTLLSRKTSSGGLGVAAGLSSHGGTLIIGKAGSDYGSEMSSPKRKKKKKDPEARQRLKVRKMVKDLLLTILDDVETEATRRRRQAARNFTEERREVNKQRRKNAQAKMLGEQMQQRISTVSVKDLTVGTASGTSSTASTFATSSGVGGQQIVRSSSMSVIDNGVKKFPNETSRPSSSLVNSKSKPVALSTPGNKPVGGKDSPPLDLKRKNASSSADQKTAPTVPDTLSGFSGATQSMAVNTPEGAVVREAVAQSAITSAGEESPVSADIDRPKKLSTGENVRACVTGQPAPPLPTFLGPGNANSASSSVASSLEVPHPMRHQPPRHQSSCELKEDDVGYHLIKMCDRLSEDMSIFMSRRNMALSVRRRERGALLAALQDSVSKIWVGRCHVEMYGSCATQLDLPSSDLDVVISGLDHNKSTQQQRGAVDTYVGKGHKGKKKHHHHQRQAQQIENDGEDYTHEETDEVELSQSGHVQAGGEAHALSAQHQYQQYQSNQMHQVGGAGHPQYSQYYPYYMHPPLSLNGERVLRLAADLEHQPWAIQVKAIPTASVPVIKMLADPSRIPGAVGGVDWIMQQQQLAVAQSGAPLVDPASGADSSKSTPPPSERPLERHQSGAEAHDAYFKTDTSGQVVPSLPPSGPPHPYHHPSQMPPWRGADVMNGLLSLDITFEGPEHGGIGSTAYSARVVQDACDTTGLPPEATPAVQTIMVIKELLAQRRLNEPFSGGLSSYALLLLVVAVIKERRIIREEMERIERQRKASFASDRRCSGGKSTELTGSIASAATVVKATNSYSSMAAKVNMPPKQKQPKPMLSNVEENKKLSSTLLKPWPVQAQKQPMPQGSPPAAATISSAPSSISSSTAVTEKAATQKKPLLQVKQQQVEGDRALMSQNIAVVPSTEGQVSVTPTTKSANGIASFKDIVTSSGKSKVATPPSVPVKVKSSWAAIAKKKTAAPRSAVNIKTQGLPHAQRTKLDERLGISALSSVTDKNSAPSGMASASKSDCPGIVAKDAKQQKGKEALIASGPSQGFSTEPQATNPHANSSVGVDPVVTVTPSTSSDNGVDMSPVKGSEGVVSGTERGGLPTLLFPQGSNDVLEVLCSGDLTAGKLLMHFMLFYGQHFDSQTTAVDVSGTHHQDYNWPRQQINGQHQLLSPFIARSAGGSIDPISGMYTVDPIVIYDPLEGAESNNVARSCFAWGTIRSVFAQCYMTLSGSVERGSSGTSGAATSSSGRRSNDRVLAGGTGGGILTTAHHPKGDCSEGDKSVTGSGVYHTGWGRSPSGNLDQEGTVDGGSSILALMLSF